MIWAVSLSTTELIPRSLTAALSLTGIRSLVDFGKLVGPLGQPVLYLRQETRDAAPICISGRTSYHRVCLAFHPYPQVIPQVFNPGGFGPPRGLTRASTCPWVDHSASGLQHATQNALFRLAFATATPHGLTLPHTVTRRLILQKARGHFTSARRLNTLPRLVGTRFQVLFHDPSPGHFSPFPHGTCSLSVTREYLGLGGGPPRFTRDFPGPVLLGHTSGSRKSFAYGGVTLYADAFHTSSATQAISYSLPDQQFRLDGPATPVTQRLLAITRNRFGLLPLSLTTTQGIAVAFSSCGY